MCEREKEKERERKNARKSAQARENERREGGRELEEGVGEGRVEQVVFIAVHVCINSHPHAYRDREQHARMK